ncbi:MAG: ATP synthase F1 subunit gamma [bacterium]|nr:ATP synthase F1 subunit gamma [bacterium]
MPSLKDLRRRLRSVKNTQMITRAMRSVAASKMRRTQDRRTKAKPYVDRLQRLIANLVGSVGSEGQPLLQQREIKRRLLVVISSDRGLCGAFNNTIIRYADDYRKSLAEPNSLYIIGKRANSVFVRRGVNIVNAHIDFNGNVDVPRVLAIARELTELFLSGKFDSIELIHNQAINAMTYRPRREVLLPLKSDELAPKSEGEEERQPLDYIFEPDPQTLLKGLLPKYLETKLLFTVVDAFATEHQARMMAMTTANLNCRELIDSLTLQINKARQASITKEILEIVGGANALE